MFTLSQERLLKKLKFWNSLKRLILIGPVRQREPPVRCWLPANLQLADKLRKMRSILRLLSGSCPENSTRRAAVSGQLFFFIRIRFMIRFSQNFSFGIDWKAMVHTQEPAGGEPKVRGF
jgi:hypothetical protein